MNAIWQVLLALLAAAGLLSLGWLLFGRLVRPAGGAGQVYAVVPAAGDGAGLEQTVKGLLWLRDGELARFTVVIADDGLEERWLPPCWRGAGAWCSARRSGWGSICGHRDRMGFDKSPRG